MNVPDLVAVTTDGVYLDGVLLDLPITEVRVSCPAQGPMIVSLDIFAKRVDMEGL